MLCNIQALCMYKGFHVKISSPFAQYTHFFQQVNYWKYSVKDILNFIVTGNLHVKKQDKRTHQYHWLKRKHTPRRMDEMYSEIRNLETIIDDSQVKGSMQMILYCS